MNVFITGGTGYLGKRLIRMLAAKGHTVYALVRPASLHKLPEEAQPVIADAFDARTFQRFIPPQSVFVQLLGVAHPGPSKHEQFRSIDLRSVQESVKAAQFAQASTFVYVSVAQTPVRIMHAYQQVRAEGEQLIARSGLKGVCIRPWYIIGPGHYWPLLFLPFFMLLEQIPLTAAKAKALRLVSLAQMLATLIRAVEEPPPQHLRIIDIEAIRKAG